MSLYLVSGHEDSDNESPGVDCSQVTDGNLPFVRDCTKCTDGYVATAEN